MNRKSWWEKPANEDVVVFMETMQRDPERYIERDFGSWSIFSTLENRVSIRYEHNLLQDDTGTDRKTYFVCKACKGWIRYPVARGVFDIPSMRFLPPSMRDEPKCACCLNVELARGDQFIVEAPREMGEFWDGNAETFHEYALRTRLFDFFGEDLAKMKLLPLLRLRVEQLKEREAFQRELEHALF